jgi:hypothetical protein
MIKERDKQYCKICRKILSKKNKSSICSNCQQIRVIELIKKGILKL